MGINILAFTQKGLALGRRLFRTLAPGEAELYVKSAHYSPQSWGEAICWKEGVEAFAGQAFAQGRALLFIGAAGICVRAIAPFVRDKLADAPVLCMDTAGRYVIPLLSGHVGGANAWAWRIEKLLGAAAVITTATDVEGEFAIDLFALAHGLEIVDRQGILLISSALLAGGRVGISAPGLEGAELPQGLYAQAYPPRGPVDVVISGKEEELALGRLGLRSRSYVLGMGCRLGKSLEALEAFALEQLAGAGVDPGEVAALCSIDRKAREAGLLALAAKWRWPFWTFAPEELADVEGNFATSDFVLSQMGVDNVCSRAALLGLSRAGLAGKEADRVGAAFAGGRLMVDKARGEGMTLSLARGSRKWDFALGKGYGHENNRK